MSKAKRARGRTRQRRTVHSGQKSAQGGSKAPAARPATPAKYAGLTVYDPTTRTVRGGLRDGADRAPEAVPVERSGRAAIPAPGALPSRGFFLQVPNQSDRYREHLGAACPYCVAPGWVEEKGWPEPLQCHVWVTPNVMCCDTASAKDGQHHYQCFYWEHVENATPF